MASALITAVTFWFALQALAAVLRYGFGVRHLVLGWASVSVQTSALNRLFYTIGRRHHSELTQWFGFGILVAAMLGASTTFILIRELWQAVKWVDEATTVGGSTSKSWVSRLTIPGVTVPWHHAVYLWIATAVSIGVHEVGHALAAAAEGVGISHVAGFTMLLLPGACVALDTEALAAIGPWRTLRVVCAGVWHNATLCTSCWMAAFLLPFLLLPAYSTGHGAVVRSIREDSPLAQHLRQADVITRLNQCEVRNGAEWLNCITRPHAAGSLEVGTSLAASRLLEIMDRPEAKPNAGFCISYDLQAHGRECKSSHECSVGELCFHETAVRGRKLSDGAASPQPDAGTRRFFAYGARRKSSDADFEEGSGRGLTAGRAKLSKICVDARLAVASQQCSLPGSFAESAGGRCPSMSSCHQPILARGEELIKVCYKTGFNKHAAAGERLEDSTQTAFRHLSGSTNRSHGAGGWARRMQQSRADGVEESGAYTSRKVDKLCPDFLPFVGSRGSLFQAVKVTDYCPAAWWVPMRLPHVIEQLLAYTFAVSAALALLNMAPVYGLDGEAALRFSLRLGEGNGRAYGAPRLHGSLQVGRRLVRACVMNVGTAIFGILLALHLLRLTGYDVALTRALAAARHLLKFSVRWG